MPAWMPGLEFSLSEGRLLLDLETRANVDLGGLAMNKTDAALQLAALVPGSRV
jgi:hypothetical protein